MERIRGAAERTRRGGVLGGLGGFGGLFELPQGYEQPVLVGATDGIGTKLKLAADMGRHDTIGIDLVAMCANDIIVCGAEPLFFLDYYATGHLSAETAATVVEGIGRGCEQAGCALIGGETAEMPGMYAGEDYDLAGFCVGIVEKSRIIDGGKVAAGDALIGLASNGVHANGFSLTRKVLERSGAQLDDAFGDSTLGETLLAPTRIYVKPLLELMKAVEVRALAHITGGGLLENLPRVLPADLGAKVDASSWQWPPIFRWLQEQGNVADDEMRRVFNCGAGMAVCVAEADAGNAVRLLEKAGETAWRMGRIEAAADNRVVFD